MSELEARGIPGVYIASNEFVEAGAAQARALGFEASAVHVRHPIQDRTDAEIHELARSAADEIASKLLA